MNEPAPLNENLRQRLIEDLGRFEDARKYYRDRHRDAVDRLDVAILDAMKHGLTRAEITDAIGLNVTFRQEVGLRALDKRASGKI